MVLDLLRGCPESPIDQAPDRRQHSINQSERGGVADPHEKPGTRLTSANVATNSAQSHRNSANRQRSEYSHTAASRKMKEVHALTDLLVPDLSSSELKRGQGSPSEPMALSGEPATWPDSLWPFRNFKNFENRDSPGKIRERDTREKGQET